MLKNLKCIECGSMNAVLHTDPRNPPLDEFDCLCADCTYTAISVCIQELEAHIESLLQEQEQLS